MDSFLVKTFNPRIKLWFYSSVICYGSAPQRPRNIIQGITIQGVYQVMKVLTVFVKMWIIFLHNMYFVFPWMIQILLDVPDITERMCYEWGFVRFFSVPPHSWSFYKICGFLTQYISLNHMKFAGILISVQLRRQH